MSAQIIDGAAVAARLRQQLAGRVAEIKTRTARVPGLAVVLVGEDPASQVYVRNKGKATVEVGMRSIEHKLDAATSEAALLELVAKLNADQEVDGILVQLPLPKHINADRVLQAIDPDKDVDGFHPINAGRLMTGQPALVPCTPSGCMLLLKEALPSLSGLNAVVVGRSNIVGKPIAQLLLQADCTVTIAHSRTRDLPSVCRQADVVIAAVGKPEMVRGDWLKPGAVVINVGINRIAGAEGKSKLVGDVATAEAIPHVKAITPVPGGVGPMTIACLLANTLTAFERRNGG
ncbi:MAG: bifunctional methylenetetrahydrofolate dehydrogenase/methenyltetrahydrofolate cyclohydrolase FolD [Steroidobacteraceae bacterium]